MDERSGCSQATCVIKCAFIMQHVSICFKQVLPILTSDLRQIRDGMSELGSWKCLLNAGIFFVVKLRAVTGSSSVNVWKSCVFSELQVKAQAEKKCLSIQSPLQQANSMMVTIHSLRTRSDSPAQNRLYHKICLGKQLTWCLILRDIDSSSSWEAFFG